MPQEPPRFVVSVCAVMIPPAKVLGGALAEEASRGDLGHLRNAVPDVSALAAAEEGHFQAG